MPINEFIRISPAKAHEKQPNTEIKKTVIHWRHGGDNVIVTGDFDNWEKSVKMEYHPMTQSHIAYVYMDRSVNQHFKFIVDDVWRCSLDYITDLDSNGNTNNLLYPIKKSIIMDLKSELKKLI